MPEGNEIDWSRAPWDKLMEHLGTRFHEYFREASPGLTALAQKVARVHGSRHAELHLLADSVTGLFQALEIQMAATERALIPQVGRRPHTEEAVAALQAGNKSILGTLREIRGQTDGFIFPADACNSYRALFQGLERLDAMAGEYAHLENNALLARLSGSGEHEGAGVSQPEMDRTRQGQPPFCCGL